MESEGLSLREGLQRSGLSPDAVWLLYVGIGGCESAGELAALIDGDEYSSTALSPHAHNLIAQALNDHFSEHGQNHPVAYRATSPAD